MSSPENSNSLSRQWQRHIDAWQNTDLSKAQYCRNNELSYHVFNYWHAKLAAGSKSGKLVPVALSTPRESAKLASLQLHLPNGVYISGIQIDSVELVGHLIAQL